MTNHMHLAVQAGNMPLSRGMQNLAFRYTRWINDRDGRTGHLFQGLYKALLGTATATCWNSCATSLSIRYELGW